MKSHDIELMLPVWVLPALVNNDESGLTDEEVTALESLDELASAHAAEHNAASYNWQAAPLASEKTGFQYFNDIPGKLGKLGADCQPVRLVLMIYNRYEYFINLDERGEFSADLRREDGKTVVEITTEVATDLVLDGFVKNVRDVDEMAQYFRDAGVIEHNAVVTKGN